MKTETPKDVYCCDIQATVTFTVDDAGSIYFQVFTPQGCSSIFSQTGLDSHPLMRIIPTRVVSALHKVERELRGREEKNNGERKGGCGCIGCLLLGNPTKN